MDEDLDMEDFVEPIEPQAETPEAIPLHEGKYVEIKLIQVAERVREDEGDLEELAESIRKYGLLQPICIDKDFNLIAGARRLKACIMLGLKDIRVQFLEDLDELSRKEIELEENIRRKDFTWIEEVKAKAEIDRIKKMKYGAGAPGKDEGWGLRDTAELLGVSVGGLSQDVELARAVDYFPELIKEKSKTVAYKKYRRMLEDKIRLELSRRGDFVADTSNIILGDAVEVVKRMAPESVDLIYTDPPWGVNVEEAISAKVSGRSTNFDDSADVYTDLMATIIPEWYRILKNDRFLYIWFGFTYYITLIHLLTKAGFTVRRQPIVWNREHHGKTLGAPKLASAYEPCFQAWKGHFPGMTWSMPDLVTLPREETRRRIYHPLEHPVELDRMIIDASGKVGDVVLDCFAGGGTVYEAGYSCGRVPIVVEKSPEYHAAILERASKLKTEELLDGGRDQE